MRPLVIIICHHIYDIFKTCLRTLFLNLAIFSQCLCLNLLPFRKIEEISEQCKKGNPLISPQNRRKPNNGAVSFRRAFVTCSWHDAFPTVRQTNIHECCSVCSLHTRVTCTWNCETTPDTIPQAIRSASCQVEL